MTFRRNKYGVSSRADRTWKGITYHSKSEMIRAKDLDILIRCGEIKSYESQVKFALGKDFNYVADFVVTMPGGAKHVEEIKGFETSLFKITRRLWKKYGPMKMLILKRKRSDWTREILDGKDTDET